MLITIFTPTYNRADLLPRLYESLCRQTYKDFEWVIVNDGSKDNTDNVVEGFIKDSILPINYIKQKNGGKHRAINKGLKAAKGELFFIADSDDYLTDDSLEVVATEYIKVKTNKSIAGIAGLDAKVDEGIIGSGLSVDSIDCNAIDIRYKYGVTGDMKEVFRTEVLEEFPFPEIDGESFCPEALVWNRIAKKYMLRYINKPIYVAEYQEGGITVGITRVRMNSPIATIMCYAELQQTVIPFFQKLKAAINYWRFRYCVIGKKDIPSIGFCWNVVAPIGYLMHRRDMKTIKQ